MHRISDIDEIEHRWCPFWEGIIVHTKFTLSLIGFYWKYVIRCKL
jgi:hypothetical protein